MLGKLYNYMQKNQTGLVCHTYIKINYKWIRDLKVKPETTKLLEENTGSMLIVSAIFFGYLSSDKRNKSKNKKKWDYIKLKQWRKLSIETIKLKMPPIEWKKIPVDDISDKGLISKYTKNSYNSTSKKKNTKNQWRNVQIT